MNNNLYKEMLIYLFYELGLEESSIELGLKLAIKNNTPLPILLMGYGMLTMKNLISYIHFISKI